MKSFKDMIFIQFIHNFEEYVLVGSYDSLWNLVIFIEKSFNDLDNIVNCKFVQLQKSKRKRGKAIIERKSIEWYQ